MPGTSVDPQQVHTLQHTPAQAATCSPAQSSGLNETYLCKKSKFSEE